MHRHNPSKFLFASLVLGAIFLQGCTNVRQGSAAVEFDRHAESELSKTYKTIGFNLPASAADLKPSLLPAGMQEVSYQNADVRVALVAGPFDAGSPKISSGPVTFIENGNKVQGTGYWAAWSVSQSFSLNVADKSGVTLDEFKDSYAHPFRFGMFTDPIKAPAGGSPALEEFGATQSYYNSADLAAKLNANWPGISAKTAGFALLYGIPVDRYRQKYVSAAETIAIPWCSDDSVPEFVTAKAVLRSSRPYDATVMAAQVKILRGLAEDTKDAKGESVREPLQRAAALINAAALLAAVGDFDQSRAAAVAAEGISPEVANSAASLRKDVDTLEKNAKRH